MVLNKMENLKEDIMRELVQTYGNRLNLSSIKKDKENFLPILSAIIPVGTSENKTAIINTASKETI